MQIVKPRARYFDTFRSWLVFAHGEWAFNPSLDVAIDEFHKKWLDRQLRRRKGLNRQKVVL